MAGAATADAAIPAPATLRNSRRFMGMFLPIHGCERCECNSAHPRVILKLLPLRPAARKFAASLSPGRGARKGESPRHADPLPPNVDVKLHLRMDAAEDQERSGRGEDDLDGLARLLGAGIEVERGIEDT